MKVRDQLLKEHTKANCDRIIKWVGNDQQRFDELFALFLNGEPVVKQRAAWPLSYAVENHPGLIRKHFGKLLKNLEKPGLHDAVRRNTVRLLQYVPIPEKYQGNVMNTCFECIASPLEKPAVKAFSLTILLNLAAYYPEIKQELKTVIDSRWDFETAAFKARARKILKEL